MFRIVFIGWVFLQSFSIVSDVYAKNLRYAAVGDSYTIGTGIVEKDSWPSQLVKRLKDAGIKIDLVTNPAHAGWTSQQAIDFELPVLNKLKPDFVTLLIGVNDWIQGINYKIFTINVRTLLDRLQAQLAHANRLLLVTIPDFSCSPQGKTWGYGKSAINGIKRFNNILKSEAASRGMSVVDIYELSQEICMQPGMFTQDNLHPSARQYSRWVDLIFPVVYELLNRK